MNNNKHLKPKLLDPIIEKKIIKTLNPVKEDYWEPTKNGFRSAYENYIKPNFLLVFFIIIVILFLIYRYRIIRNRRELVETEKKYKITDNMPSQSSIIDNKNQNQSEYASDEQTQLLLHLYNKQKEKMREPPIKNSKSPQFAYPMYPYGHGGTLTPSHSR